MMFFICCLALGLALGLALAQKLSIILATSSDYFPGSE